MKTLFLLSLMVLVINNIAAQETETVITYPLGNFRVSILSEDESQRDAGLLKGTTPEMLRKYLPEGMFPMDLQVFLVRTPDKNILIDAGYGKNLFKNLQSLGIAEADIHVILLTHLHGDHIGGLLRDGKIAFPNAEIYLSQAEYDYWTTEKPADAVRKIMAAYKDKLHVFVPSEPEEQSAELFPGFRAIAACGHTPGHKAGIIICFER
ncbi:MAG: MBL fold metallo-hydrolase [Dysgonamonadaceae bacterium]|jgi:glyoxylase-like metal-dependent hydrolase (beta-lactamase superfamily II)|nr:MBL fold metallo-hydrolase [Dysgonamonadaceae bacterium]